MKQPGHLDVHLRIVEAIKTDDKSVINNTFL